MSAVIEFAEPFERINVAVADGVMTVTVARPEARNALDIATIRELRTLAGQLPVLGDVSVVLLESEGPDAFIAGGDLREFALLKGERAGQALSESMARVTCMFEELPQIVIAAINGDAYGGGVELSLACDLRWMSRHSRLHFAQARFGLTTAWGGAYRLTRLVGYSRALEILLDARTLDASQCLELGLVNQILEPDDFVEESKTRALGIAKMGRQLVWGLKQVARAAATRSQDDAMLVERKTFGELWASQAHEAKVRSFMEKKAWTTPEPKPEPSDGGDPSAQ